MTTDKILSRTVKALELVKKHSPAALELETLRAELEEQIRTETAKAKGCGSAFAIVRRMLKKAAKDSASREQLGYAWSDETGRQLTCDGYRAFRLLNPLPLPVMPENVKPFDIAKLINEAAAGERQPLELPSIPGLKSYIKIHKAEHGPKAGAAAWNFGEYLPKVNAEYLLDLLTVIPGAQLYVSTEAPLIKPLYAQGDAGDALLLPLMDAEKKGRT